eukprot:COSAG05_NODE_10367_length_569_cov_0.934043_1_plen_86_part_01
MKRAGLAATAPCCRTTLSQERLGQSRQAGSQPTGLPMRGQSLLALTYTLLSLLCSAQDVPTSCVNLEELNIFANAVNTACCGEIGC